MIFIITKTYTNISIDNARCNYNRSTGIGIDIDIDIETSFNVSCKLIKILVVVYFINETKSYGYSFKIHMT